MPMQRTLLPLLIVLILQLALTAGLLMRHDPLAARTSDAPLIRPDAIKSADQLVIEAKPAAGASAGASTAASAGASSEPAHVTLKKKDGSWVLPESFDAPADGPRVDTLLGRLTGLKRGLPIATSEAAQRRFKVEDGDFERKLTLSAAGKTIDTVYFGSSPGLRKADARTAADKAVYAVDLPTYELPTDPGAWLSPDLLKLDPAKLSELDVSSGAQGTVRLVRQKGAPGQPGGWTDPALSGDSHVDVTHADALVQDLSQIHIEAVLGTGPQADWQQDHPALAVKLLDEKSQSVDWTLSKPANGDFYVIKSSAQPWFFSVSTATGKQLIDAAGHDALIVTAKPAARPPPKPAARAAGKS